MLHESRLATGMQGGGQDRLPAPNARLALQHHAWPRRPSGTARLLREDAAGGRVQPHPALDERRHLEVVRPGRPPTRSLGLASRALPHSRAPHGPRALHRTLPRLLRHRQRSQDHAQGVGKVPRARGGKSSLHFLIFQKFISCSWCYIFVWNFIKISEAGE